MIMATGGGTANASSSSEPPGGGSGGYATIGQPHLATQDLRTLVSLIGNGGRGRNVATGLVLHHLLMPGHWLPEVTVLYR